MMANPPGGPQVVSAQRLLDLLTKAKADPGFRDALIKSPNATLQADGLRPTPTLVSFFESLTPANFDQEVTQAEQAMSHPLVNGEASVGSAAEAVV